MKIDSESKVRGRQRLVNYFLITVIEDALKTVGCTKFSLQNKACCLHKTNQKKMLWTWRYLEVLQKCNIPVPNVLYSSLEESDAIIKYPGIWSWGIDFSVLCRLLCFNGKPQWQKNRNQLSSLRNWHFKAYKNLLVLLINWAPKIVKE